MTKPKQDEEPTITIGDNTYVIRGLPTEVQDMIAYYQRWTDERIEAMSEVNKCDAACRALSVEITKRLKDFDAAVAAVQP